MGSEMINIKGTRDGLIIILDQNREFEELKKTLQNKMESARGFFKGAKFTFSGGHTSIPADQKLELEEICRQHGLEPSNIKIRNTLKPSGKTCQTSPSLSKIKNGEAALLVQHSLRSGQGVSHPGHVVIIGDVHPGAEVVSGGNILVMGSCRGYVHAGSDSNSKARVIARILAPTVISIAGRRFTPAISENSHPGYMSARLSGQEIVFEKYCPGR